MPRKPRPKTGRPPGRPSRFRRAGETRRRMVSFAQENHDLAAAAAAREGISFSDAVQEAIVAHFGKPAVDEVHA